MYPHRAKTGAYPSVRSGGHHRPK